MVELKIASFCCCVITTAATITVKATATMAEAAVAPNAEAPAWGTAPGFALAIVPSPAET